jgi:serine protease Do
VVSINDARAQRLELKATHGVIIIDIKSGTPADKAGFEVGDVIVGIGSKTISDMSDYRDAMAGLKKEKPVIFHVQRGERKLYVAVTP